MNYLIVFHLGQQNILQDMAIGDETSMLDTDNIKTIWAKSFFQQFCNQLINDGQHCERMPILGTLLVRFFRNQFEHIYSSLTRKVAYPPKLVDHSQTIIL